MDQKSSKLDNSDNYTADTVKNDAVITSDTDTAYSTSLDNTDFEKRDTDADLTSSTDEPEEIKAQIEETRSQMSETINAIEEKFNFSKISEQVKEGVSEQITNAMDTAKDAVYDATIGKAENIMQSVSKGFSDNFGDAGSYVVKSAKGNPLPLALIGIGAGMLFMQRNKRRSNEYDYKLNDYRRNYVAGDYNQMDDETVTRQRSDSNTGGILENAQETVGSVASSAYSGVSSLASKTGEQASNLGGHVQNVASRGLSQYEQTLQDSPLIVGAVALALGAAVGLSIPATDYENQWMGDKKEDLVQSVEGVARDAFSKVQEVAGEVTKTVQEQTKS
ncbi:MAG: DUF3618 domain-containing protein [Acidobacteria bacterium]|nr:DUF3618 domain-containing protein [Acidobacteriota bacterium]